MGEVNYTLLNLLTKLEKLQANVIALCENFLYTKFACWGKRVS